MLLTALEWLWWAAPGLFNLIALGLIQWALHIDRRANAHAVAADERLVAEQAKASEKIAEVELQAATQVAEAQSRADLRAREAELCVRQAEAPERILSQAPEVAVRCWVGEVRAVGGTLFIPVWVENRMRHTPICVEEVSVQPLVSTGRDWSQEREVPVQQEDPGAREIGGLGEHCFLCSASLPAATSSPTPGRVQLVRLSGVQGYCNVKGPWGEQRVRLRPLGRRLLLPEEA